MPTTQRTDTVSSPLNDYNYGTNARRQIAVFARSEVEFVNARIMVRHRSGGAWSAPAPIAFSDPATAIRIPG